MQFFHTGGKAFSHIYLRKGNVILTRMNNSFCMCPLLFLRHRTILYISIMYAVGNGVMAVGAIPFEGEGQYMA